MKEIKRYVCEYCGTEYSNKDNAKKCEANHASKAKVVKEFFQPLSVDRTGVPTKFVITRKGQDFVDKYIKNSKRKEVRNRKTK